MTGLGTCEWFLLCENPATHLREHPVLDPVPTCDRCGQRTDRLSQPRPCSARIVTEDRAYTCKREAGHAGQHRSKSTTWSDVHYECLTEGCTEEVEEGQPLCLEHRRQVQARLGGIR